MLIEFVLTRIALNVFKCELDLILAWNVFPGGKEDFLLHCTIFSKEDMSWDYAGKIEHVNIVLHCHLQVGQRLHPLDRALGTQWHTDIHTLVGWNAGNIDLSRRDQAKAVLVELDAKVVHRLHGFVGEAHFHVDLA